MLDVLGREKFVESVFSMMLKASEKKKSLSFAIDAPWGAGKSFVLDMLDEKLRMEQCEDTATDRFLVIRYNSWEYDYYDEPIIAIVAAMQDSLIQQSVDYKISKLENEGVKIAYEALKMIANQVTKNRLGIDVTEIIDTTLRDNDNFDKLSGLKQAICDVRNSIETITSIYTVVILIDELDRCIPKNVIKILNRCSHLFDGIDNLQIVYSLYSRQIDHSITAIFGNDIEPDKYLKKFIDNKFVLDFGVVDDALLELFEDYFAQFDLEDKNVRNDVLAFIKSLDLDIRSIEKIIEKVQLSHYMMVGSDCEALLLFEIMVAFLSYKYGIELFIKHMRLYDVEVLVKLQFYPDNSKTKLLNQVLGTWSYKGINRHSSYVGKYKLNDNAYGTLIASLNNIFEIDNSILNMEGFDAEKTIGECQDFWDVYTKTI